MDPRVSLLVVIIVGFGIFINIVITNPIAESERISYDIARLVQGCKLSNSVTFTECLRRQKRQHEEIDYKCMEECMAECKMEHKEGHCEESCKRCVKRTTPTFKKKRVVNTTSTEYEPDIKVDEKKNTPAVVNVTNHIHVHNHYNTSAASTDTGSKIMVGNPYACPCLFIWIPCYCRPQYPICQYPYQWPFDQYGGFGPIPPAFGPFIIPQPSNPTSATATSATTSTTVPATPPMSATPTMSIKPTVSTTETILATPVLSDSTISRSLVF